MSETIINPKPPSPHDLSVLAYMDEGNSIHHTIALNKFKTTALRDIVYRLKKAGYEVYSKWVFYNSQDGTPKKYKLYWTKGNEILKTGAKTQKELLKGTKPVHEISKDMQRVTSPSLVKQQSLFNLP